MLELVLISQINKLIWFQYNSTGCLTCHNTPIERINDSIYVLGSFHYNNGLRTMLMGIKVKQGITVEWYRAFNSNPSLNLGISDILKINDTLIAVAGGHGGCGANTNCSFYGLFNLNTKNFIWARYLTSKGMAHGLAYDGNSLLVAVMGYDASSQGAIIKSDLNGNVIWARQTSFGCLRNDNYTIIPEANGYVVMGIGWWCGSWQPVIYRISSDGSTATLIRGFSSNYRAYRLIRDNDGNYALIGFYEPVYIAYLTRISPNGNILYSRGYTANNDLRFYDIELDLDGHYLLGGTMRIGQTDYPMAMKINRNDGSVIWARYWAGAPANQRHNQAKGIAPVKLNKILVSGYLGTAVESHNGFLVVLDSIDCMNSFNVSVGNFNFSNWSPSITLSNYTGVSSLSLSTYNFSITQAPSCQVQPISDSEYKSCNYRIYSGKGYIGVSSEKELNISIYSINGYKIRDVKIKEGKVPIKSGMYILRVNGEVLKLFVK